MVSPGFVRQARNTVLWPQFFLNAAQFGEMRRIFTGKVPQSFDCGALQDGTLSGSAAHMKG